MVRIVLCPNMKLRKQNDYVPPTPEHLRHLEISLEPFVSDGRTFRVVGTEIDLVEYVDGRKVVTGQHRHLVREVGTDNRWTIPHARVKAQQDAYFTR